MSRAEKFIIDSTKNYSNEKRITVGKISHWEKQHWLTPDEARKAVEIAREEIIEKAIKWVEYNNENGGCKFDGWVENIRQAMKDE
jgi:hypothetical protein